jgi:hypothetical protein
MAVRVKVRLKPRGKGKRVIIESSALINSGYETEAPEIVIPIGLAERLGFYPQLPQKTTIERYEVAGGGDTEVYFIKNCIEVSIITEDKESPPVLSNVVIMSEREVLISDKLASKHGVVIEEIGEGMWRFRDEKKIRRSTYPQHW